MKKARIESERKNITLKRDTYYTLVELKGQLKAETWEDLVKKIKDKLDMCKEREKLIY